LHAGNKRKYIEKQPFYNVKVTDLRWYIKIYCEYEEA
jgi:hypothetical protein